MPRVQKKAAPAPTLSDDMESTRERFAAMAGVAGRFTRMRPARQVLTRVQGVKTIFPSINLATKIGGWPIRRIALIHGASGEGKTKLGLGLGRSFLERAHFFALVDAEHTTEEAWINSLRVPFDSPGFSAQRPASYEDAVDGIREWAETIAEARVKGDIPPETTGFALVDSIGKLAPKDLLKKIQAGADADDAPKRGGKSNKPKRGIDGMGGRAAQYKAALNSAWMNELVPLMASTGCSIGIITREIEDPDAGMFDEGFKLTGGKALFYDSSLVVRVANDTFLYRGEGAQRELLGERHRVEIRKSKIGRRDQKVPKAYFNDSNGTLVPSGFDIPRDYLDLGQEFGEVEIRGSAYMLGKKRLGQGEHAAVKRLHEDASLFAELREIVEECIRKRLDEEPGAASPESLSSESSEEAPA
jgi:recombination protein RecA